MLDEYTLPALLIVFVCGLVIGINVGMICSRSDDSIPAYVFRKENLPVRYPGTQNMGFDNMQSINHRGASLEPSGKRRMANQFNY